MMRVLDTSVLVDILRGDQHVTDRFRAMQCSELRVSAVTAGELIAGAAMARDTQRELFSVDLLLRPLKTLSLDAQTARRAGLIDVMLMKAGIRIGTSDRLIAATALQHDAVVVTSDKRHFLRVPGLVIEDWRTPQSA